MKSHLEKKIKEKAASELQEAVRTFRKEIFDSVRKLTCNVEYINNDADALKKDSLAFKCISIIVSDNYRKGWPAELWEIREKAITEEIVEKMDIVGRVLNFNPSPVTESLEVK